MSVLPPVDWTKVERLRIGTKTQYTMVTSETDIFLMGYRLTRTSDGGLELTTVTGEDDTSRVMDLIEKALISKRTPLKQNLTYGNWEPQ